MTSSLASLFRPGSYIHSLLPLYFLKYIQGKCTCCNAVLHLKPTSDLLFQTEDDSHGLVQDQQLCLRFVALQVQLDHPAQLLERLVDVADTKTLPCVVGHPSLPLSLHLLLWSQVLIVIVATETNDEDKDEKWKKKQGMKVGEEESEKEDLKMKVVFAYLSRFNTNLQCCRFAEARLQQQQGLGTDTMLGCILAVSRATLFFIYFVTYSLLDVGSHQEAV